MMRIKMHSWSYQIGYALICCLSALVSSCSSEVSVETGASINSSRATVAEKEAVLFIGGFGTKGERFADYFKTLQTNFKTVKFQPLSGKWLDPDHWKDLADAEKAFDDLLNQGHEKVILIGYSAGGKHAAKISLRRPGQVSALVLLDPVDGGMGGDPEKTPVFLNDGDMIVTPTVLLASEFGHVPKIMDRACAPKDRGHNHFREHINENALLHYEVLKGTSHLNFVAKPWSFAMSLACDNGKENHDTAMNQILSTVQRFLPLTGR